VTVLAPLRGFRGTCRKATCQFRVTQGEMRTSSEAREYLVDAFGTDALADGPHSAGDSPSAHYIMTDRRLGTTASAVCDIPTARRLIDQSEAALDQQEADSAFGQTCNFHWGG
jgi:hypothetical protein